MPGIRPNVLSMAGYVPGEQPRGGDYVKLNTNENPYPPSPRAFEAIRSALTGDRLRKYPEPLGDTFREAASKVIGVAPDQILIGNGSDDILTILTRAFVHEGGLVASPTPSYLCTRLASIRSEVPHGAVHRRLAPSASVAHRERGPHFHRQSELAVGDVHRPVDDLEAGRSVGSPGGPG